VSVGFGDGGGRRWRRSVLTAPVGVGGATRCWWRGEATVVSVGTGGATGCWRRHQVLVAGGGDGGVGRYWRRHRLLAAPVVGGGAGANVSKGGVSAVGGGGQASVRQCTNHSGSPYHLCVCLFCPIAHRPEKQNMYTEAPRKTKHVYQGDDEVLLFFSSGTINHCDGHKDGAVPRRGRKT